MIWVAFSDISCGICYESSCTILNVLYLSVSRDYDDFLEDLEEDKTLRQNVNIFVGM